MADLTSADLDALAALVEKYEAHETCYDLTSECGACPTVLLADAMLPKAPALIREAKRAQVYREALEKIEGHLWECAADAGYSFRVANDALTRTEEL